MDEGRRGPTARSYCCKGTGAEPTKLPSEPLQYHAAPRGLNTRLRVNNITYHTPYIRASHPHITFSHHIRASHTT